MEGLENEGGRTAPALQAGAMFDGFQLIEPIAGGGMGVIWKAEEVALGRQVVLKFLRPDRLASREAVERFRREAMAEARGQHAGIVTVYALGYANGQPYIAQELIEGGRNLAHLIAEARERHETSRAYYRNVAELVAQAADALGAAHAAGVVHRDVKPHNLLLSPSGRLKVADFGLARVTGADTLTDSGAALGTFPYASPEQVLGKHELDPRADIFSLGATFYELLTFQRAFDGDSVNAIVRKVLYLDPPDPHRISSHVPKDLALLCTKALEKRADDRFANMREFSDELRRFLADQPLLTRAPSALHFVRKWVRRHPATSLSAAVVALAVGSVTWLAVVNASVRDARTLAEIDTLHTQAQLAIEGGELERARTLIERAGELDPRDYTGPLILAAGFTKYSRRPEAERELQRARDLGFSSDPHRLTTALEHGAYGVYLFSLNDFARYPEAEAEIRQALALDPGLYALNYALYCMCAARGDNDGARAPLAKLRDSLRSGDPFAVVLTALDTDLAGDPRAALALLEGLPTRSGIDVAQLDKLRWQREAGRLCYRLGELPRAESYLRRAVTDVPGDCWSWGTLAAVYLARILQGDDSPESATAARDCAERAKDCSPSIQAPHLVLAHLALGEYARVSQAPDPARGTARQAARAALDELRAVYGDGAGEVHALESRLLSLDADYPRKHDQHARAIELLERALQLDPQNLPAHALLGQSCWYEKDFAHGLEVLQRGLEQWDDPSWSGQREPAWLGVLLAWTLGDAEKVGDAAAFASARKRLVDELKRGTRFANEELFSAAEFLGTAPESMRDCELAHGLLEEHDLAKVFEGTSNEREVRRVLAEIDKSCP